MTAKRFPDANEIREAADVVDRIHKAIAGDESARRKPGRKASKRTFQLHPKVLPEVGEAFADEAVRLDLTQGQLLEKLWAAYQAD